MADRILVGDALTTLKELPPECADLVITSPPYFQQRRYTDLPEEIGAEKSADEYLQRLLAVFDECLRITRPRGSVVFNLGDKYIDANLMLIPWRFALEARQRATLINNVTWIKKNPTPRQFNRRLVSATEPFFHFVKQNDYRYDLAATSSAPRKSTCGNGKNVGQKYSQLIDQADLTAEEKSAAHAALQAVITEVQAGTLFGFRMKIRRVHSLAFGGQPGGRNTQIRKNGFTIIRFRGDLLRPDHIFAAVENIRGCKHPAVYPVKIVEQFIRLTTEPGDLVVDPFIGSGTTAVAAQGLGRRWWPNAVGRICATSRRILSSHGATSNQKHPKLSTNICPRCRRFSIGSSVNAVFPPMRSPALEPWRCADGNAASVELSLPGRLPGSWRSLAHAPRSTVSRC